MEENNKNVVDIAEEYLSRTWIDAGAAGDGVVAGTLRSYLVDVIAKYRGAMEDVKRDGEVINDLRDDLREARSAFDASSARWEAAMEQVNKLQEIRDNLVNRNASIASNLEGVFDTIREAVISGEIDADASWLTRLERFGFERSVEREVTITVEATIRGTVMIPLGMSDDEAREFIAEEMDISVDESWYSKKMDWNHYESEVTEVEVDFD